MVHGLLGSGLLGSRLLWSEVHTSAYFERARYSSRIGGALERTSEPYNYNWDILSVRILLAERGSKWLHVIWITQSDSKNKVLVIRVNNILKYS